MKRWLMLFFIFLNAVSLRGYAQSPNGEDKMDSPFGVLEFLHWNHDWNSFKYPDQAALDKTVSLMKEAGI